MLVWLALDSHDALVRALGFLDVVSLVHCEMSSKFVKNAASDAWIAVDKAIDAKRKAYGETPRQRAIRSSPIYRRHLLSQYAARVEKLRPSSSEALVYGAEVMQGDDYDFCMMYVPEWEGGGVSIEFDGRRRKCRHTFTGNEWKFTMILE